MIKQSYKKICTGILAAIIAVNGSFTPFTVNSVAAASNALKGGDTKGSGSIEGIISKDVYNVVLPVVPQTNVNTSNSTTYDFILDPKGLMPDKHPDKDFESGQTLFFKNADGSYKHTSDDLTIQNRSTMSVDVKLKASIKNMGNVILTNDNAFADDENASVCLTLTDGNNKISAIDKYGGFLQTTLEGNDEAYKVVYDSASNKYKYELKSDDELAAENITFDEYHFQLAGSCNSASDWSELAGALSPQLTTTWIVSPRAENLAPSVEKTSYVMTKGIANQIEVDLGSGNLAATDIQSITYRDSAGSSAALASNNYTLANGTLEFNAFYITDLIESGVTSCEYTVTFNDAASTQAVITLEVNDAPPSVIGQTNYDMHKDQPIQVKIDLGHGNLAATGIKSITFVKDGSTVILPTNLYTYKNGTLNFTAQLINNMLRAGFNEREYTINFNDTANTKATVKLKADGQVPSITDNDPSYPMLRDQEIEINVDLGSGELAATDIQSITFADPNNKDNILELPVSRYSFDSARSVLTFNASYSNAFIDAGFVSREHTIIFNDMANTKAKVTLTAVDVEPSIGGTEYTMSKDTPIDVTVDLGAGTKRASGIKSITFVKDGSTVTLPANLYTYENGTLRFTAQLINNMLGAGYYDRIYTIHLNDTANTQKDVRLKVEGRAPSITDTNPSYSMYRDQEIQVNVDLGDGDIKATDIKTITFVMDGSVRELPTSRYSFNSARSVLTFNASYSNAFIDAGFVSREHTIIFNDMANTKAKVTLTAVDVEPSIGGTEYTMSKDQPIDVKLDLGAGTKKASGIKYITFQINGKTETLRAEMYTYENGTLRFTAQLINNMLHAGYYDRTYTIHLNDTANTKKDVRLKVEGRTPSITDTNPSYSMYRDQEIQVNVDLGDGDIKATDIKTITFVMDGSVRELPTSRYSFNSARGVLTFNASYSNAFIDAGFVSREHTIIFNDMANTKVKVTLTAVDVEPSIGGTEYTMSKDQPIDVRLDLGAGTKKASGIKYITFNINGKTETLRTEMYTYENGTLRFTAQLINNMLRAGYYDRIYTIHLNDTANTQKDVRLKVEGRAPSIVDTNPSYSMYRNREIRINLDLGDGDIKATKINSITFNLNGIITALPTDKYYLSGNVLVLNTAYSNAFIRNGFVNRVHTINFDDIAGTHKTFSVTAVSEMPSIAVTSYTMRRNQAIPVSIDLGAGQERATGVSSITFQLNGIIHALNNSLYTFSGETLTFKAQLINNMFNAGYTSRDYTIILNNKSKTRITIHMAG